MIVTLQPGHRPVEQPATRVPDDVDNAWARPHTGSTDCLSQEQKLRTGTTCTAPTLIQASIPPLGGFDARNNPWTLGCGQ